MNNLSYACHGVHTKLAKGKASGCLSISKNLVRFEIGEHIIEGTPAQLAIEIGGANNCLVFFTLAGFPDWRFYSADRAVLKDPVLCMEPTLQATIARAKRKRLFNWLISAPLLFAFIFIPVFIVMKMDVASRFAAEQVPVQWEQHIGAASFAQYQLSSEFLDAERANTLLAPLVSPLISAIDNKRFDYQFYIVENASLNAFALPGGIVVINSGLILAADNPEQLLGVIAHEISHVRERHGLRNMISTVGGYLVISSVLGDVSGLVAVLAEAAPVLIGQSYSRDFERAADKSGFHLLVKARINPSGLADFFQKLHIKEQKMIDKLGADEHSDTIQTGLALLSTHPTTNERISTLNAMQIPTQTYLDLSTEFAALQSATEQFVTNGGFDEPHDNTIESKSSHKKE